MEILATWHAEVELIQTGRKWQFQIWRENLSGFQRKTDFGGFPVTKSITHQDYVKNLTGLALNLELLGRKWQFATPAAMFEFLRTQVEG